MKEATKRAASEALAQMAAVTAMLVIAGVIWLKLADRTIPSTSSGGEPGGLPAECGVSP